MEPIFTVGHSNSTIGRFVAILKQHGITAVADVRSTPYSRQNPHFDREHIQRSLKETGVAYVFLGDFLGARPKDRRLYSNGQVQYKIIANSSAFKTGIDRVAKGREQYRIALMCAEKEPLECHRMLMVGHALHKLGLPVCHILAGGQVESHDDACNRLAKLAGLGELDLFGSTAELAEQAIAWQESRITKATGRVNI